MEVHAHTHTERKRFKHYLWEFLMLFLAVFCGFLAENIREHTVELRKEKEYMKEIVENLKYDTVRCALNAEKNIAFTTALDSFRIALKKAIDGSRNGNELYYFNLQYSGKFNHAVFNTSTITELKNSGSLRLIENKKLIDELADYYERKIPAANYFLPTTEQQSALQKASNKLFSLLYLDDYITSYDDISETQYSNNYNYQSILNHQPALQLLTNDPKDLEKYYTQISQFETTIKYYNFWLFFNKKAAKQLIEDIQADYHLK